MSIIKINKSIARETDFTQSTKTGRLCYKDEEGKSIIIYIHPDETIEFRVKGTKTRYHLSIGSAFLLAKANTLIQNYHEKLKAYKIDKESGKRRKKPVPPLLPFSKSFFQILK